MLPEFELLMPTTLAEALEMLNARQPDVMPLAGGTNLIPDMRAGTHAPSTVVNLWGLEELRGIRREREHIVAGSGMTVAELLAHPLVAEQAPMLSDAARGFANPLIRNRATLGGNLGQASPAGDTGPPLLVLGAEVELSTSEGSRWVKLEEFFVHVCETVCEPSELITSVRWPARASTTRGGFRKLTLRKAMAVTVASVAAQVTLDGSGRCREARIAMGSVAPTPIRAYQAEEMLLGERLRPELIEAVTPVACGAASCIGDVRSSAAYRERLTDVLVRRVLSDLTKE